MATFSIQNGESAVGTAAADVFQITEDLLLAATINGGAGTDTVDAQVARTIGPNVAFVSVENLALDAETLTIAAEDFQPFSRIVADTGATTGRLAFSAGGTFAFTEVSDLQTLDVTGSSGDDWLQFAPVGAVVTDIDFSGGAGADDIVTGAGDDRLDGGAGLDSLDSGGGDDTLRVGSGDVAVGGDGDDTFEVTDGLLLAGTFNGNFGINTLDFQGNGFIGDGVIINGMDNLALDGASLALSATKLAGFGRIVADDGAATGNLTLVDSGAPVFAAIEVSQLATLNVTGSGDVDRLFFVSVGPADTDVDVDAGGGADEITTGDGDDELRGGGGGDDLAAGAGADLLVGAGGADGLSGGGGADTLRGGAGGDELQGGGGADTFAFEEGGGTDDVLDFTNGVDLLSFAGFGAAFNTAGEIVAAADQVGGNTVITLPNPGPGSTVVRLVGFDVDDLNAADFGPIVA